MNGFQARAVGLMTLIALLSFGEPPASAQTGCLQGNLIGSLGFNGTLKVCPGPGAKVPEVQKQLDDIQKTLSGNQALLREVNHAVRGVNALGKDVDETRQVELLRSLGKELQSWMADDQKQTMQQISQLADKLDTLQDNIAQSREDAKTAQQTATALNGRLGDAIAALDVANAQQQLESIQAKLDKIGADTEQTRRIVEEQAAREKAAADAEKKKEDDMDKDPNMYTRAQIMPSKSPLNNQLRLMVFFYSRPPLYPPFVDSKFSMSFRKGAGEAWRMDATDKQVSAGGELWHLTLNPDDVGDRATVCFVAHDRPSGRLKEWTQGYKLSPSNVPSQMVNFVPEGDAKMYLTDGEPCDGVTEVRKEPAAAPPTLASASGLPASGPSTDEQVRQQMAKIQEQLAARYGQVRTSMPASATFARIMAEGSRKDRVNGGQWQIKVNTQSARASQQLYDEHVEANLVDESGRVTPLQLSNRQLFVNIESRYASVTRMGTKAVVCMTAKTASMDKPQRLTQWFSIETSRVYWMEGGAQVPGEKATFVPAKPAELTEASEAACQ